MTLLSDEDYDKLVSENAELTKQLTIEEKKVQDEGLKILKIEHEIDSMEDASFVGAIVSYVVCLIITFLVISYLTNELYWNKLNIIFACSWCSWFFSVFTYYGVWRFKCQKLRSQK